MLSASQLIKKLLNIKDTIINDNSESTSTTYSSTKINSLINAIPKQSTPSSSSASSGPATFEIWEYK